MQHVDDGLRAVFECIGTSVVNPSKNACEPKDELYIGANFPVCGITGMRGSMTQSFPSISSSCEPSANGFASYRVACTHKTHTVPTQGRHPYVWE